MDPEAEQDISLFTDTVTIHGREFQKYAVDYNVHFMPVDPDMATFLELLHSVLVLAAGGGLVHAPVQNMRRVLELGYGAANWSIEMAENYPEISVVGIDISAHKLPEETPPNFEFEIDDFNNPLAFPTNHFDLIHACCIADGVSVRKRSQLAREMKRTLQPGGWCQLIELYNMVQSDNGSIEEHHALRRWSKRYLRSIETLKNTRAALSMHTELLGAGFINVGRQLIQLPLTSWSREPDKNNIGSLMESLVEEYFNSISLLPLTRYTLMPIDEFNKLIEDAAAEARDPRFKAYIPLYVCVGQKPPLQDPQPSGST